MLKTNNSAISIRLAIAVCLLLALLLPVADEAAATPAKTSPSLEGVLNLNTATEAELVLLPRVGEAVARRIIAFREQHGPFQQPEDLMNIQGIGERTFDRLKPHLAVEGETTLRKRPAADAAPPAGK